MLLMIEALKQSDSRLRTLQSQGISTRIEASYSNVRLNLCRTGLKLIILDEADAMTSAAQAALRRGKKERDSLALIQIAVMEKYTKSTRFCILCNYLGKIIPAIQSRCTRFRFGPLGDEAVSNRLKEIAKLERYWGFLFGFGILRLFGVQCKPDRRWTEGIGHSGQRRYEKELEYPAGKWLKGILLSNQPSLPTWHSPA